jgi:hypothetical protein
VVRAQGFDDAIDERFTTFIDVSDFLHKRREALLAHRTQVDPTGFWMRLPDEVVRAGLPVGGSSCSHVLWSTRSCRRRCGGRPLRRLARTRPHLTERPATRDVMSKYLSQEWIDESVSSRIANPSVRGICACSTS